MLSKQGLKAVSFLGLFAARLKSCPDTFRSLLSFFRRL
jgi:hypothetical protein